MWKSSMIVDIYYFILGVMSMTSIKMILKMLKEFLDFNECNHVCFPSEISINDKITPISLDSMLNLKYLHSIMHL